MRIEKDQERLFNICAAVRSVVSGQMNFAYEIADESKEWVLADFRPIEGGYLIRFYDLFFEQSWDKQISTIIHEHVHYLVHPIRGNDKATREKCVRDIEYVLNELLKCRLFWRFSTWKEKLIHTLDYLGV